MDKRITDFINRQKTASICCLDLEGNPYCFTVFFVFDKDSATLYFKSSASSNHSGWLLLHNRVAGTILPDKLNLLVIRGIQFTGIISRANATAYHKKLPMALTMPGEVWAVELETIKMTDNTLGIGKKICWEKSHSVAIGK